MAKIEDSIGYVLQNEGGFSNDPLDRGGATKYGITRKTLSAWRGRPVAIDEVKNLTLEEATKIYKAQYWNPLNLNLVLEQNIATAIFDMAVLRGTIPAAKLVQRTLVNLGFETVLVDGHIGIQTLAILNKVNSIDFLKEFESLTELGFFNIVKKNKSQSKFLKGWLNRAKRLLTLFKK